MTVQELGRSVRFRRQQMGVSQESFAAKAGISLRKLSDIECGNGNPTFDTMDSIAAAFGIQIEELICADVEVDLLPRNDLSRLQPMLDRLPEAQQELFLSAAEGVLIQWTERSRAGHGAAYNKWGFDTGYGRGSGVPLPFLWSKNITSLP